MFAFLNNTTPGKAIVIMLGAAVMLVIWLLNNVFTFSYGYDVIGPFLMVSQLGQEGSRLLSGLTTVLFFDAAYTVAFLTLLFACTSVWQYGVIGLQFIICLILSIGASVIAVILLSPLGQIMPEELLTVARYAGYAGLVAGFVVNCLSAIGYIMTSPHMAQALRKSMRQAKEMATTNAADDKLDDESQRLAVSRIEQEIPALAEQRALALYLSYLASIGGQYDIGRIPASTNGHHTAPQQLAAQGQPAPTLRHRRKVRREGQGFTTEIIDPPQRPS